MKIAGLDIGTTGCKCTVFDEQGKYLGKSYRDYPVKRSVGGHEVDVSVVMDGVYACIREMTEQYPDIAGIGVTSFGETFVCVDEEGTPLHTAMLYTDKRGGKQCRQLAEKLGTKHIAHITGLRPHEMYSISKMMWIKEEMPQVYAKTKHIFQMEDYVVYHLTGVAIGVFKDIEEAAAHMVEETVTYKPRTEMHEKYMRNYERYKKIYQAVRPLMN